MTAFVNLGCSQTIIQEGLDPSLKHSRAKIQLQCIHGDIQPYLTTWERPKVYFSEEVLQVGMVHS